MTERQYIIRNGWEKAWLVSVIQEKGQRTYRYLPEPEKAKRFSSLTEARRIAHECRGYVFRLKKSAEPEATEE